MIDTYWINSAGLGLQPHDGRLAVIGGGADGSLWVLDTTTGDVRYRARDSTGNKRPLTGSVSALAVSPKNDKIAVATESDGQIISIPTFTVESVFRTKSRNGIWFSADGQLQIAGNGLELPLKDGRREKQPGNAPYQKIYSPNGLIAYVHTISGSRLIEDVSTGRTLAELPRVVGFGPFPVAFSSDGKHLLRADGQNVDLFRSDNGQKVWSSSAAGTVKALAYDHHGSFVVIGTNRGQISMLETGKGREVIRTDGMGPIWALSFSLDDRTIFVITGDSELVLRRLPVKPKDVILQACKHLSRNMSKNEWFQFLPDSTYRRTCPDWP